LDAKSATGKMLNLVSSIRSDMIFVQFAMFLYRLRDTSRLLTMLGQERDRLYIVSCHTVPVELDRVKSPASGIYQKERHSTGARPQLPTQFRVDAETVDKDDMTGFFGYDQLKSLPLKVCIS
jgi:hypothetical protein